MKHKIFSLILAAVVAAAPLFGQGKDKEEAVPAEPTTGVRFVSCSPSNITIPSPLYVKAGKSSRQIRITSRMPSSRVKPVGTTIALYDKDPGATPEKKQGAAAKQEEEEIKPVITLEVPGEMTTGKVLCVLVPTDKENPFKVKPMFVKESAFPKSGVHIINMTATPLQMKLSEKGDYTDATIAKIGAFKGGISKENTWSSPSGKDGQQFSFILSATAKGKDLQRIKASRFSVSSRQSQINLVVKDPTRGNYRLMTIQLHDKETEKR